MYPHLIEVHDEDGSLITFNIDHVIWFNQDSVLMTDYDNYYGGFNLKESYDELKALIHDAGCIIAKKDPRLDDTPLTMDDLKEMIGEPVFNSNTRKWGLIRNYIEAEPGGNDVAFVLDAGDNNNPITAADLLTKPMYRMKVTE